MNEPLVIKIHLPFKLFIFSSPPLLSSLELRHAKVYEPLNFKVCASVLMNRATRRVLRGGGVAFDAMPGGKATAVGTFFFVTLKPIGTALT